MIRLLKHLAMVKQCEFKDVDTEISAPTALQRTWNSYFVQLSLLKQYAFAPTCGAILAGVQGPGQYCHVGWSTNRTMNAVANYYNSLYCVSYITYSFMTNQIQKSK